MGTPMSNPAAPSPPPFGRQDPVIPTYVFHLLNTLLQEQGLDTEQLTADTGIQAGELIEDGTFVSFDQGIKLIGNALRLSDDSALGLSVGSRESISDMGVLGYAIVSSKNLREVLQLTRRYVQTSTNLTKFDVSFQQAECHLQITPTHPVDADLYRYLVDEDLAVTVKLVRDYFHPEYTPLAVHFSYPAPPQQQRYHDFFRCPVHFDTEVSQIIFEEKGLDFTNPKHNPVSKNLALKMCEQMLAQQNAQRGLVGRVQSAILSQPGNFPSTQEVAERLNMSERSLRRRLKELDTSYQEIFNLVRRDIALRYLQDTKLELEDIAQLVGFSDSSSFYRSFKRWTNKAPSEFRHASRP